MAAAKKLADKEQSGIESNWQITHDKPETVTPQLKIAMFVSVTLTSNTFLNC